MIRVVLVDDHEMVRIGVSAYLSAQTDIIVAGEAATGADGVQKVLALRPDIILMDLVMEPMNGIEATRQIIHNWPEAKIIIVTSFLDDDKVYPAIEAGAVSYLLKTAKASEIADAIRRTAAGQSVLEPEVTEKVMARMKAKKDRQLHDSLTPREVEVLLQMARGKSNQEIAEDLYISLKTVKVHVSNILSKLEVQDRTQAVIYAFQHNLCQ
ncbi:response regulator [Sporolactobacillus spathodeae]|uniref:NarL family two-component system response regulator LiaR n=1 Tax=Sporolactobacillus spathodeae TaxID=1465502 RepID=A0ABS2QBT5_9BACL|nr:response regulator transcription factor [Sporolactobacillus spathodeae]MBM7659101.1 NarL family two-component system response regulator LiaR [Sporolactobacillus spathodeae]